MEIDRDSERQRTFARAVRNLPFQAPADPDGRAVGENLRFLQAVVDSTLDAILAAERGRIVLFNVAAEQLFLCPLTSALGQPLEQFLPGCGENDPAAGLLSRTATLTGRRTDGGEFPAEASVSQLELAGRRLQVVILRDISRRRDLEAQLLQAQKMEAFGALAGGVAHEFNNIVSLVIGYSDLLMGEGCCLPAGRGYARQINDAGRRAAALTRQLLAFARKETMRFRPESLNYLVNDIARLLRGVVGQGIHIDLELDVSGPMVAADASMVEQVLVNLGLNAREAMPHGGRLTLSTRSLEVSWAQAANARVAPGSYAILRMADTGVGMGPEVLGRLFEPFFTTKPRGKGAGLGLAAVRHIMREHGGWVEAASERGKGSVFTVYFPRLAQAPAAPPSGARQPETASILVVEDEEPVRELVLKVLANRGHRAVGVGSAGEALRVWKERRSELEILITDVVLPGSISGAELAVQFQKSQPSLRVLFMSGYMGDDVSREAARQAGRALLAKPFSPDQLLAAVQETLGAGAR